MTDFETIADQYVALWNETDRDTRRLALRAGWSADARYVDPVMAGDGHDGIDGLIAGVHQQFPGFVFRRMGKADSHGVHGRFSWGLGPEGAEPVVEGTDFIVVADGKIQSVTGFLDRVPV